MTSLTITCQAVLFDLDGVLVDSRSVVERTWQRWLQRHGIARGDIVQRAHGRRSIETVREVAPELDATVEVRWLESAELNDTEGLTALPGAARALSAVPDTRRAVVTSGGRALAMRRLEAAGLPCPSVLVAAEDVERGKPAPDGYLLAASRLGIDVRECVVVEDTPPGIAAGQSAGARVICVVTTFASALLTAADVVVPSLEALRIGRSPVGLRVDVSPAGDDASA